MIGMVDMHVCIAGAGVPVGRSRVLGSQGRNMRWGGRSGRWRMAIGWWRSRWLRAGNGGNRRTHLLNDPEAV